MPYYFKKPTFTELTPAQLLALEEVEPIAIKQIKKIKYVV